MRVLLFDPSGTTNYCNGLADGLNEHRDVELDVVVRDNYSALIDESYSIYKYFLLSDKYAKNKIRKATNYLKGYYKTILQIRKKRYDIFHVQWFLNYTVDIFFLKIIRKYVKHIVYTAHNIKPHVEGDKQINHLKKIYSLVDKIVVHGEASKEELLSNFDIEPDKIVIQAHGLNNRICPKYSCDKVSECFKEKISKCQGKIYLYLGVIFENKGVDRLFNYWAKNTEKNVDDLLIVAGMISEETENYKKSVKEIKEIRNILYKPGRVSVEDHHYLYEHASVVVLPYRHASMSGVVFDAATFSTPILTTDVGCISEYLENSKDSFVVKNTDNDFNEMMDKIHCMDSKVLIEMGKQLNINISVKCNWSTIATKLIKDAYE